MAKFVDSHTHCEFSPDSRMKMADAVEKPRILKSIQDTISLTDLIRTNNFDAIKWFHEHGVSQVFASGREFYRHS